jgi:hypothetical protein
VARIVGAQPRGGQPQGAGGGTTRTRRGQRSMVATAKITAVLDAAAMFRAAGLA